MYETVSTDGLVEIGSMLRSLPPASDDSAIPTPAGEIWIISPTRHRYQHAPPDPPGTIPRPDPRSPVEARLVELLRAS